MERLECIRYRIQYFIVVTVRIVFRFFGLFLPVKKNRILFCSFHGMQYTCNPKYIFESLYRQYGRQFEYVWVIDDATKIPEEFRLVVKTVKFRSLKYICHMMRADVIIDNSGFEVALPKRKKQLFINTWHGGGAYKKVAAGFNMRSKGLAWYIRRIQKLTNGTTDCFLSSSKAFTEVTAKDFHIDRSCFVPTGMPRNDRFFYPSAGRSRNLRQQICGLYDIVPDNLLVLYAPTFRNNGRNMRNIDSDVCCPCIEHALAMTFGRNITFLYRRHICRNDIATHSRHGTPDVVDLTQYPDMQDLLDIADVLITDYSSSIWDFALTGKPGFLYMPDLPEYEYDRGFYTPLDKWPFPYAESIDELCELIAAYNAEENEKRISDHYRLLGSYECGKAIPSVIEIIKGHTC